MSADIRERLHCWVSNLMKRGVARCSVKYVYSNTCLAADFRFRVLYGVYSRLK